ncbi:EF hand [Devosia lucknowensis]|uniref:EF hand n=1 Tax=Devosia lucknowensis TaxID=1096929 RepID=A0A1Y6GDH5_9HYPH|nr:EF-hand domain-containing protein [Devosia lucknowensis]SMQ86129.1 EF hand [Devosia lucknowensis]
MKKFVLGLAALAALSVPALAQAPLNFADVDTDGNGELSFVELQAVWPDLTQEQFAAADLDGSGGLNAEELNGLQPATLAPAPMDGGAMAPAPLDGMAPAPAPEPAPSGDAGTSLLNTN